jgi:hypothetical protein
MTPDDVDVAFVPSHGLLTEERNAWCQLIAQAVANDRGTLTVVFVQGPGGWEMRSFLWHAPGGSFVEVASPAKAAPLRERALAALRAAGKPIIGTRANGA